MEQGAIEWVAGQTGIMGVASMALFFLRRAYDQSLQREKQYSEENRADKIMLMTLLSENARVLSELRAVIELYVRSMPNERAKQ
ncbi:MAG: hypothetical protein ACSLEZ_14430 [Thiobacillus sp.]